MHGLLLTTTYIYVQETFESPRVSQSINSNWVLREKTIRIQTHLANRATHTHTHPAHKQLFCWVSSWGDLLFDILPTYFGATTCSISASFTVALQGAEVHSVAVGVRGSGREACGHIQNVAKF